MLTFLNVFGIKIPLYGLCMMIGIFLCSFMAIKRAKAYNITFEDMIILIAVTVGSALLCGSGLYIAVTYTPQQIWEYIRNFDFSFIANGGIVFYGGLIGGLIGAIICIKCLKLDIGNLEKSIVPYIPIGHAIGRVGCLMAGCCYGFEYNGFCAVTNNLVPGDSTFFPIQGVEALLNILVGFILLIYAKKERKKYSILALYLAMYSVIRFTLEFFRGDTIRGAYLVFSTSQWISIFLFLLCLISAFLYFRKEK